MFHYSCLSAEEQQDLLCPARARWDNYSSRLNHLALRPLVDSVLPPRLSLSAGLPPPANSQVLRHPGVVAFLHSWRQ